MPLFRRTSTGNLVTLLFTLIPKLASLLFAFTVQIAEVSDTDMTIFDGGWQTVTTKSRLNALCDEFCIAGEGVFQKDFQWFVRKFVAESSITGKVYNVEDFTNGYVFA